MRRHRCWTKPQTSAYSHQTLEAGGCLRKKVKGTNVGSDQQIQVRQMVGLRLHAMRLHSNLRQETAAQAINKSIATISRMEHGLVPFRRHDLLTLLTLYGVGDPYQQETLLSVALGHREPGWWDAHDVPLRETVQWSHEQGADLIRTYQPFLVPDLLQTEEYARAAHHARHYPSPPEAGEISVKNLLRRQQARRARLWAVIDEPVLRRPIGGDLAMHVRQLDALADASRRQDVTIQIVPMDSPHLPSAAPFTIFRLPSRQVFTLHRYTGDKSTELAAAEHWGLLWDQLIGVARRRADTPQILARIREHLRPPTGGRVPPSGGCS